MKGYRYVNLSANDLAELTKGYENGAKHHFRERCQAIILSHRNYTIPKIAILLGKRCDTIRKWFNNWEHSQVAGLQISSGRGLKPTLKLANEDLVALVKEKVNKQPLKLLNILDDISIFTGVPVSKEMLKKFLKQLKYSYRRIRKSLRKEPDPAVYNAKLDEIINLIRLEKDNLIKIYYADASGFNETPCVPYGWQPKNAPMSMPSTHGQRWNVFGIMSSNNELFAKKTKGSINADFVIGAINNFADDINRCPLSVIILDNASVHHSKKFKDNIPQWKEMGVQIFYLPTYSPHLNRIETFWRKCKYEWLLPADYVSWEALSTKIDYILANFGTEFTIKFSEF